MATDRTDTITCGMLGAVTAAYVTHPVDLIKVRMQLPRTSSIGIVNTCVKVAETGMLGFMRGATATIARQFTYSLCRFAAYDAIKPRIARDNKLMNRVTSGVIAGSFGAAVASPFEMVLVRMQSNSVSYPEKNLVAGMRNILKNESLGAFSKAFAATVTRAALITATQLTCYEYVRDALKDRNVMGDTINAHYIASATAGLVSAIVTNPIDLLKTRMMANGDKAFTGLLQCARFTIAHEGLRGLYRGFVLNTLRMMPQTVITFIAYEKFIKGAQFLRVMAKANTDYEE